MSSSMGYGPGGFGKYRGPGSGGAPSLTMAGVKGPNGETYKDAYGFRLYDTFRIKAGTAIPTSEFYFFQIPIGNQTSGLNFAAQYAKTKIDTNMQSNGQIQKGRLFVVHSMQFRLIESGATDTTYGSSGAGTEMPTAPAGAAAVSAVNEEKALLEGGFGTFVVDNRDFEEGKFIHFPSPYGISGFAGGGIPGTSNTDAVAVANNGFGRPYRFPIPRYLDGLRQFQVKSQFAYPITPTRNSNLECCLEGFLYRDVL
jgi:hypothetical protein